MGQMMIAMPRIISNISDQEREVIKNALLKYCELDTLAMVMI